MDTRRLFLAFLLSLGVLRLWGKLFPSPEPPTTSPVPVETGAPAAEPVIPSEQPAVIQEAAPEAPTEPLAEAELRGEPIMAAAEARTVV